MEHTKERRTELLLDSWRDETKFFQEIDLKPSQNSFHNSSSSILFSTFDNWLFCLEERSIWGQMASDDNPNWGNEVLEPTAPSVTQPSCPANAGTTELTAPIAEDPKNNVDEHFSSNMSREVKLHQPNKEEIETEEAGILLRENILQLKKEILQAKVNQLSLKMLNQIIIRPCDLRERPAKGNMSSLNPNATPWTPSVSLKQNIIKRSVSSSLLPTVFLFHLQTTQFKKILSFCLLTKSTARILWPSLHGMSILLI